MANHYWGAVLRVGTEAGERFVERADQPTHVWRHAHPGRDLYLEVSGSAWQVSCWEDCRLLVRGPLVLRTARPGIHPSTYVYQYYQEYDDLPVHELEGSFTLVLLDGTAGRVVLYRNLVGTGFTYYARTPDGLFFGSNLVELLAAAGVTARVNTDVLPAFFLFRAVPGRQTLFAGVYRLMPGEQVTFDAQGVQRRQRQTFAELRTGPPLGCDVVEALETTLTDIMADWASHQPRTANLLSGGVDSSYLQAIWNRVAEASGEPMRSFSVSVAHPRTRPDTEYALSAAQALGTHHTLIPADEPYAGYLGETLAVTGEPPNHVMTAYFGTLARAMRAADVPAGLCGEGADSLFGLPAADALRVAQAARRWLPIPGVRQATAGLLRYAGRPYLAAAVELADIVADVTAVEHPINQAAVFTDLPAVRACFGDEAIAAALAQRRALLDHYQVGDNLLDRLHAIGYLGEAVDTASLWTTLFNAFGGDLCCPYLDSRLLRLVLNLEPACRYRWRRPKDLLKRALARYVPRALVERRKLGFGQPIFEWLAPGGSLRPWVERIAAYPFVPPATRAQVLARPSWFLYSLLCFDLWHQQFIDRRLSPTQLQAVLKPVAHR